MTFSPKKRAKESLCEARLATTQQVPTRRAERAGKWRHSAVTYFAASTESGCLTHKIACGRNKRNGRMEGCTDGWVDARAVDGWEELGLDGWMEG